MIKLFPASLLAAGLMLFGCAVNQAMQSEPGTDVSAVRPGIERSVVENLLGQPLREWTTEKKIHYCLYAYDGGRPASAGDASALLFLDVISLGLAELFISLDEDFAVRPRRESHIAVAYDSGNRVVGVFDDVGDFDVLPIDGVKAAGTNGMNGKP